ncbi:hypothetical protein OB919_10915 [Halobacteria archaeon AArc-curdl1]|uniref:DUF7344 domain-containing protein n=1 Tax=Natronosalvus hydrolyticus TaxID=2979988 RepID=A0AAP2Z8X7_9EURY|nr:hypothetical protein [Halobacteria archaeon AArc-curdl1]
MKAEDISIEEQSECTTDSANDPGETAKRFSMDEIFHLLQNERRRMVLRYLRGTEGPVRMRDVAEQVAAWEHHTTVEQLTSTQRQRVYIPLYQSHLKKLDKAGVIEYQQDRGIVERKPLADQVDQYLEIEPTTESTDENGGQGPEWGDYYIGTTVVGYAVVLGAVMELPFTSFISGIGLAALILLLYTVVTIGWNIN